MWTYMSTCMRCMASCQGPRDKRLSLMTDVFPLPLPFSTFALGTLPAPRDDVLLATLPPVTSNFRFLQIRETNRLISALDMWMMATAKAALVLYSLLVDFKIVPHSAPGASFGSSENLSSTDHYTLAAELLGP